MDSMQKEKYFAALAGAIALVIGPRDEDYNKGGIDLRDYWQVNGIRSPLQMVDMKIKRALSQIANWDTAQMGTDMPIPKNRIDVDKLSESMFDLINYAAFVICEAESLWDDHGDIDPTPAYLGHGTEKLNVWPSLPTRIKEAVELWMNGRRS